MRIVALIALTLTSVCVPALAAPRGEGGMPNAAMFRRGEAIEFYDFRLRISHSGRGAQAVVTDCSNGEFYCFSGVSVLLAPRDCSDLRRLIRRGSDWRVGDAASARFLFASEDQLYLSSSATGGFVYDIERGIIGVWHSEAAAQQTLDTTSMRAIVDSTKWLESPAALFACR